MKKFIVLLISIFIYQNAGKAQTCGYLLLTNNAEIEMSMFDKKNEPSGKVVYKVLSSNGKEAKVVSKVYNEKGKEMGGGEGIYKCDGTNFSFDMKAMLPSDQSKAMNMKDMEVKTNSATLNYPSNMTVGSTLPDNEFTADTYSGTMKLMGMSFKVTNRKVEGKESITTPAGTFDCFKITSNQDFKTIFNFNVQMTEWFSPNVGVVKTEAYRKGSLFSSTLITKISK
jgi:hypothetical protein